MWNKMPFAVIAIGTIYSLGCQPPATDSASAPATTEQDKESAGLTDALTGKISGAPTERVKAEVGVGKQGRSLDNEEGIGGAIVEPARQLFAFKEKAVFDIQIPQALQLFKATEGRLPNSHDEFMTKIIKANNIKLPELPAGQKYVFDAESGELMVER